MKLAASQIAWQPGDEGAALGLLRRYGFSGLEIAPPRVAGPTPYEDPAAATAYARFAKEEHSLALCSMQSIWYGQQGSMFGPEREALLAYTHAAIRFAAAGGCKNLVFGCPKNRVLPAGKSAADALAFFADIGAYAAENGVVVALEANPAIYGTNFINTTAEAFAMAQQVASPGFLVNLDVGTMLQNSEDVSVLEGKVSCIHHVHISAPHLAPVEKTPLHTALAALLRREEYAGYVSIEMQAQPLKVLEQTLCWVAEVFG